ncbi:MAG: hypothetical protein Unbinned3818contig1000_12 [Prokaryotic dsDNA virus sp.]|nr:MAG: hypothetical protein Unbinned3818contig1000_12 [Prokaryotic dsDNA virus sp.]
MSWVIVRLSDNEAVCELTNYKNVLKLNTEKYKAVPVLKYLGELNRKIKTESINAS